MNYLMNHIKELLHSSVLTITNIMFHLQAAVFKLLGLFHRRIVNTEEKAKVVAAVWGKEVIHFLAALAILLIQRIG